MSTISILVSAIEVDLFPEKFQRLRFTWFVLELLYHSLHQAKGRYVPRTISVVYINSSLRKSSIIIKETRWSFAHYTDTKGPRTAMKQHVKKI